MVSLRSIVLFQRSILRGCQFYVDGLGLIPQVVTENYAELTCDKMNGGAKVVLKRVDGY